MRSFFWQFSNTVVDLLGIVSLRFYLVLDEATAAVSVVDLVEVMDLRGL